MLSDNFLAKQKYCAVAQEIRHEAQLPEETGADNNRPEFGSQALNVDIGMKLPLPL